MGGEWAGPETGSALMMALVVVVIEGYPYYLILSMLLNNTASGSEVAIYFVVYTGFIGGMLATWGTAVGWLMLTLLLLLSITYPWLLGASERRAMWRMDEEDLAECDAFIQRAPMVADSYERAMTICRRRGEYARALRYAEAYIEAVGDDQRMMRRIEQFRRMLRRQATGAKVCPICDAENPAGVQDCVKCGRVLALPTDLLVGCASETGLRALAATTITLLVLGIALAMLGGGSAIVSVIFISAFATAIVYVYLRR